VDPVGSYCTDISQCTVNKTFSLQIHYLLYSYTVSTEAASPTVQMREHENSNSTPSSIAINPYPANVENIVSS